MSGVPAACGALGAFDLGRVERLRAALGGSVDEVHRDECSVLLLDREPLCWGSGSATGIAWSERVPARAGRARTAEEAAAAGACGLVFEGEHRALHASLSGVAPLYWRRCGDATYFATAIDPLTRLGPEPLAPDWESWAQIIALGYPCGDGTPFADIRRLNPLGGLEHVPGGSGRLDDGRLAWAEVEPVGADGAPEQIVTSIRAELEELDRRLPLASLLSGGLDSRLLLALLAGRGMDLRAFTADTEEGQDQDEMAAAVAASLGVPHTTVEPAPEPFADELRSAASAVEYESMLHLSMARLAGSLPGDRAAVVNGLGGDTFVKGLVLTPEVVEAPDWRSSMSAMFDRFAPTPPVAFEPGAWGAVRSTARHAFMREADRFAGHPSAATLTYFWTRTRRGVAQAPMKHFGARYEVLAPLVSDRVVRAALAAPQGSKVGSALYLRVLERANPAVARLPSTEDRRHDPPGRQRRSERAPEARRVYRELLERSPLRPWFSAPLSEGLQRGGLGGELRSHFGLRRLQGLCTLTLWLDRYRGRLSDPDPRPLVDP